MSALYRAIAILIVVAALGGLYYRYEATRPCTHPLTYSVGVFDTHFNLTESAFIADLKKAADIWNKAEGKTLLAFVPSGGMPVNLIFDTRQETANLGTTISAAETTYENDKAKVDSEESAYNGAKAAYESEVAMWNAHGGAPPNVYSNLNAELTELNVEGQQLQNDVNALNTEAHLINSEIASYNATAGELEEGEYVRTASGEHIDLYEFTNQTQLIRLAAHEFGHSLGLGHDSDPASIMYPINKGTTLTPSVDDVAAIQNLCDSSLF